MHVKSVLVGLIFGSAIAIFGAVLCGGVNLTIVDGASSQHGTGRYTFAVGPGEPATYRVFDTETGETRVFSDQGVLLHFEGGKVSGVSEAPPKPQ